MQIEDCSLQMYNTKNQDEYLKRHQEIFNKTSQKTYIRSTLQHSVWHHEESQHRLIREMWCGRCLGYLVLSLVLLRSFKNKWLSDRRVGTKRYAQDRGNLLQSMFTLGIACLIIGPQYSITIKQFNIMASRGTTGYGIQDTYISMDKCAECGFQQASNWTG